MIFTDPVKNIFSKDELARFETITISRNAEVPQVIRNSPDDLKLWLLDYKEGVEFNMYQRHPNVEKLITENSTELGIEVLRELQTILSKRGELFKGENAGHITRYNQNAEKKLPRILLDYNNEEPAKLTQKGAVIYNRLNGLLAGNEKIQVDYIDEDMIQMLTTKADRA